MNKEAAELVREFRESIGLSQAQFAMVLKTSQAVISDIENCKPISKKMAKKLACILDESIEKFL